MFWCDSTKHTHLGDFEVRRSFGQRLSQRRYFFGAVEHSCDRVTHAREPIHSCATCANAATATGTRRSAVAVAASGSSRPTAAVSICSFPATECFLVQRARVSDSIFRIVKRLIKSTYSERKARIPESALLLNYWHLVVGSKTLHSSHLFLRSNAISEISYHPRRRGKRFRAHQLLLLQRY